MQFDESYTEDEIEERSFRMVLPSEGHRQRAKKQDTQSDHGSLSSDDLHLTSGKTFSHQGICYDKIDNVKVPNSYKSQVFFLIKSHQFNPFLSLIEESHSPIEVFVIVKKGMSKF